MPFFRVAMPLPKVVRLLVALAFGMTLAGCGKCGPWFGSSDAGEVPMSCHSDAPQPH